MFRSYGFAPIDTPALEYLEILLGKGGAETDKQLYRFQDHGGRDVGLRFDLTVPLARFAAQHIGELGTPFKRYHIAAVWRGENTQRGRYREFMQCDFDTIGTRSVAADAETVLVVHDLLRAIGFERFTIHVNNRLVAYRTAGIARARQRKRRDVLRAIDKLAKVGAERVVEEIQQTAGASADQAARVVELVQANRAQRRDSLAAPPARRRRATAAERASSGSPNFRGCRRRRRSRRTRQAGRLHCSRPRLLYRHRTRDNSRRRSGVGSICSGGRYDNLAELYTNQQLPGIGASLGLDRLLAAMEELGMLAANQTPAQVFIPYFDPAHLGDYFRLAAKLRAAGLATEVYPEPTKLGKQLQYADRKGFRVAVIAGEREFAAGECQVKTSPAAKARPSRWRMAPPT